MANSLFIWWGGYAILVAIFYYFYFPQSTPLTREEIQSSLPCNSSLSVKHQSDEQVLQICEALLAKADTGNEFYALNFIKKRTSTKNLYPPDFQPDKGCADSAKNAERCYVRKFLPLAFKRFSYPIFVCSIINIPFLVSKSIDIKYDNNFEFDSFSIMRYRSRRDFLNIVEEASALNLGVYKDASVGNTINYFVDPDEIPLTTVVLFTFWCSIIYFVYSMIFRLFG
eukprot:98323_1